METIFYTNNSKIILDRKRKVVIWMNERAQCRFTTEFDAYRFMQVLDRGGKKVKVPLENGSFMEVSFNKERKHISNSGGMINTYIDNFDYELIMKELYQIFNINTRTLV